MKHILCAILLALLVGGTCLPGLGSRDFWPPDEARYGEVVRELCQGAPWILPHLNHERYDDKPPGFFLAVAGLERLLPQLKPETAARLPSALGALILVVLVGVWLSRSLGMGVGLLGGALTLASLRFGWQARYAELDMLFAACIGLMVAAFYRAWNGGSRWWCTSAFLLLFMAVFVKGPVALIPLAGVAMWSFWTGRSKSFFNLGSLLGLLLFLALLAGWLLLAFKRAESLKPGGGEDWFQTAILKQTVVRARQGLAHEKPWWAYLWLFPLNTLPFFPLVFLLASRKLRQAFSPAGRSLALFAALLLGVFLVAMSVFPGKREIYLLPVLPLFGLLLALCADLGARLHPRLVAGFGLAVAGLLALLAVAALALGWREPLGRHALTEIQTLLHLSQEGSQGPGSGFLGLFQAGLQRHLLMLGAGVLAPAAVALALGLAGSARASLIWAAVAFAVALGWGAAVVLPDVNPLESRRAVGAMVLAHEQRDGKLPVGILRHLDEGVLFYSRAPLPEVAQRMTDPKQAQEDLARWFRQPGALVVGEEKNIARLHLATGIHYRVVDRVWVKKRWFILMGTPR